VALHDEVVQKYNGGGEEVVSRRGARAPSRSATRFKARTEIKLRAR
jgi:hypothetical protein